MLGDDSVLGLSDLLLAVEDKPVDQRDRIGGVVRKGGDVWWDRLVVARARRVGRRGRGANGRCVFAGIDAARGSLLHPRGSLRDSTVREAHPGVLFQAVRRPSGPT